MTQHVRSSKVETRLLFIIARFSLDRTNLAKSFALNHVYTLQPAVSSCVRSFRNRAAAVEPDNVACRLLHWSDWCTLLRSVQRGGS